MNGRLAVLAGLFFVMSDRYLQPLADLQDLAKGEVVAAHDDYMYELEGEEVIFVRGQSRKLKLDGKEYFIIKEDKVLIHAQTNS